MNKKSPPPISKLRLKNFRKKIKNINDQELELRLQIKQLYEQFILDVQDNEMALRYVRQAYFQIQKYRIHKQMKERMEFHPFFGANPMSSDYFKEFDGDGNEEEDDLL